MHTNLSPLIARERAADRDRRLDRAKRNNAPDRPPPRQPSRAQAVRQAVIRRSAAR